MYLVELRPGKEELYRTGDELAAAIRNGDVDGHSRIYHRATSKWISITLHPQYKAIVAEKTSPPLPPLERTTWTYLNAQSETLEGAEPDVGESHSSGAQRADNGQHPWRRHLALGISGLFLLFGMQVAFSGPRPPWSGDSADTVSIAAQPETATAPADSQVVSLASSSAGWDGIEPPLEEQPAQNTPEPQAAALPKAPTIRAKSLKEALSGEIAQPANTKTVEGMIARYQADYDSARTRLESGLRVARLNQLFAAGRLAPDGGLTDTRLGLAGAANFIRVYRQQEGAIEKEYQESFTTLSRELKWTPKAVRQWYSRPAQKEPAPLASLSTHLLGRIDSLLGVLDAQAGAYKMTGERISFEDAMAARAYGTLRRQITATIDSARAAGGAESRGPMGQLLQLVGGTELPIEKL